MHMFAKHMIAMLCVWCARARVESKESSEGVEIEKSEIKDLLHSGPSSGGYHRPAVPAFANFQNSFTDILSETCDASNLLSDMERNF